jgi:hypothetical protein
VVGREDDGRVPIQARRGERAEHLADPLVDIADRGEVRVPRRRTWWSDSAISSIPDMSRNRSECESACERGMIPTAGSGTAAGS